MSNSTYKAPAIRRAVETLEFLAACPRPPSLSEISRALGYGKSTAHGLLLCLESLGWVDRGGAGYRIGPGLLDLARRASGGWDLASLARPVMEDLAERTGESVFVGALRSDVVVVLDSVEGRGDMRVSSRPGMEVPRFAAALGKVFLAGLPPEEARAALERASLPRFTERSVTDPGRFLDAVEQARNQGYAVDDEEYLRGIRAIAAPIRHGEKTVAALWVAGFSSRLSEDRMPLVAELLVEAAAAVSARFPQACTPP